MVNETYTLVRFDAQGRVDWPSTPVAVGTAGWPTVAERAQMHALLFAPAL